MVAVSEYCRVVWQVPSVHICGTNGGHVGGNEVVIVVATYAVVGVGAFEEEKQMRDAPEY